MGKRSRSRTFDDLDRTTLQESDREDYLKYLAERERRLIHLSGSGSKATKQADAHLKPALVDIRKEPGEGGKAIDAKTASRLAGE